MHRPSAAAAQNRFEVELRAGKRAAQEAVAWALVCLLVVIGNCTIADQLRLAILRSILILAAAGEALASVAAVFCPRWFSERGGRKYDPAYHGVLQDFGFYNFGFAFLLVASAVHPVTANGILMAVIAVYFVHGGTHVARFLGAYYGGGEPIPTRPRALEMRDGLQLIAAALGMALFFP